jgi:hypothetical protein
MFLGGLQVGWLAGGEGCKIFISGAADSADGLQGDGDCRREEGPRAAEEGDLQSGLPSPGHAGLPVLALAER